MNGDALRWAALRALLLDVLADATPRRPPPPHLSERIGSLLAGGASVRDVCVATRLPRDKVIAIIARMAR